MAKNPVFVEQDQIVNPLKKVNVISYAAPAIGDLDGDGDEDVLVGNNEGIIKYFRKQGNSFIEVKENKNPFNGVDVDENAAPTIFDWDGDGDQDVLVGNNRGEIKYFRNDSDSFTELTGDENPFKEVEVGNNFSCCHGYYYTNGNSVITLFDVDGDGDEDLLVGDYYGKINYFRNDGDSLTEITDSDNPFDLIDVGGDAAPRIFDVDGDGLDDDLLVGNRAGEIRYFSLKGDSWSEVTGSKNPFKGVNVGGGAKPIGFDVNGDGDQDIFVGNSGGKINYFENLKIDVNDAPLGKNDPIGISENNPLNINVLKNDFEPEAEAISLIKFEGKTKAGGTVERDNKGTPGDKTDDQLIYTPPANFSLNETDSFTYTIADPNNQKDTAKVKVLAIPLFVEQSNILNPFKTVNVVRNAKGTLGDLDGDGDEDLLVGNWWGEIKYFRNKEDSFIELSGSKNPFNGVDVFLAAPTILDVDGDGDQDVLIGHSSGNIKYFQKNGANFSELSGSKNPFDGVDVDWYAAPTGVDIDGDGDEDVLIGNEAGEIKYFRNNGDSFTEQKGNKNPFKGVDVGDYAAPTGVDADGDGDEDVLIGNQAGKIKYFRNNGDSFTQLRVSQNPFSKVNVGYDTAPTGFDADGDGDEDLLIGNKDGKIKYFENLIIDVNDPPIAKNDSVGISKKTPVTINVFKNDVDPETKPISLMKFEANTKAGGKVERDNRGTPGDKTDDRLIYTPPANFSLNETDSFSYTIVDSNNQTDTAKVNILVIPLFVEQDNFLNPFKKVQVDWNASAEIFDLDGDGDEDVLVGNDKGKIQYFRNNGDSFTELTGQDNPFNEVNNVGGYGSPRNASPEVFDVDGDGDFDVLVGNDQGKIQYFRNNGDGFKEIKNNPFAQVNVGGNASPAEFDVDGDGDQDLLVGNSSGKISYFRKDKDGFIKLIGKDNPFETIKVGDNNYLDNASPEVFDVDTDGDFDVLVGNDNGEIKYFRNEGNGFIEQKGIKNAFFGVDVGWNATLTKFDVDTDGDFDILVANGDGEIKYSENLTIDQNDAPIAKNNFIGISSKNPRKINVLSNDIEPEKDPISLIKFQRNTKAGGTVQRDNNGTSGNQTDDKLIYTPPANFDLNDTDSFTYTIADPNNQKSTATVNILAIPILGEQDNSLNPFYTLDFVQSAAPGVGDLDGDGDDDILIGNRNGFIEYFRNDGDGFTQGNDNPFEGMDVGRSVAPEIFDVDGDGDEDVLVGNWNGKIKYFRNDGESFTELTGKDNPFNKVNVGGYANPTGFDVDGDGDEDLLIGNGGGKIQYFRNDGESFTELTGKNNPFNKVNVGYSAAPTGVDLDQNGVQDLLVGNSEGEIKYFHNNGETFTELKVNQNPFKGVDVGSSADPVGFDINGDGWEDVLVGTWEYVSIFNRYGQIKYFENLTVDLTPVDILTGTPSSDTFTLGNNNISFSANII